MYSHLRFVPKTTWPVRAGVLAALKDRGVTSLKPAFPGSDHPERSTVYAIGMAPGSDTEAVQEYVRETDCLIGITQERLGEIAVAPYPEPAGRPAPKED